jgi:hypothetical protein
MNKSTIKTFFKRNKFKPDYGNFRDNWMYCNKNGRHYRVRNNTPNKEWVVDISDMDFDRWANSTEINAMSILDFMKGLK